MTHTPSPAPQPADGGRAWHDWLAEIGYGYDVVTQDRPPCSLRDIAAAQYRRDERLFGPQAVKGMTIDDYEASFEAELGKWDR